MSFLNTFIILKSNNNRAINVVKPQYVSKFYDAKFLEKGSLRHFFTKVTNMSYLHAESNDTQFFKT